MESVLDIINHVDNTNHGDKTVRNTAEPVIALSDGSSIDPSDPIDKKVPIGKSKGGKEFDQYDDIIDNGADGMNDDGDVIESADDFIDYVAGIKKEDNDAISYGGDVINEEDILADLGKFDQEQYDFEDVVDLDQKPSGHDYALDCGSMVCECASNRRRRRREVQRVSFSLQCPTIDS